MNKNWIIKVQGNYYYTNKSKIDDSLDDNFYDVIIFENKSKEEVIDIGKELYKDVRCFWNVIRYDEALKEYENRTFVYIDNVKYKWGEYLDVKEALRLSKNGYTIGCKYDNEYVYILYGKTEVIPVELILNGTFRIIEKIN